MTAAPDRTLTILLAGVGSMGGVWLRALATPEAAAIGVRLVAVCESDPNRGAAALASAGLEVPHFAALDAALDHGADILIDCTTPNARMAIAAEALARGLHVLCEKPLALDEDTATRLAGVAARSTGWLAVSQNRRFQPGVRQLRDLVASGALGRPQTLSVTLHMVPAEAGFRQRMRHVMLRDMAIHAFDAARAILGANAATVSCLARSPSGATFAHGPEVHALFEMSDGTLFTFDGNWADLGPPTSWNGTWRLTFERGAARWDGDGPAQAWAPDPGGDGGLFLAARPHPLPPPPAERSDILGSLESLVTAIRAGTPPETRVRDNARSLAMVFAAMASADADGRREAVRDLAHAGDATDRPVRRAKTGGA